jgi:intracellular septation protein A
MSVKHDIALISLEWFSLFLVIASGTATVLTDDPRFVLFKPSAIYAIIGVVMLRPGWMNRYLPAIAKATASDIATYVGFAWSGLMFISAILNAYLAFKYRLRHLGSDDDDIRCRQQSNSVHLRIYGNTADGATPGPCHAGR